MSGRDTALPPVGWGDVATKHDLDQLEQRLELRVNANVDRRLSELQHRLSTQMIAVKGASIFAVAALAFAAARLT